FYYIIVKAFRVAFLWYLFSGKIPSCRRDSTEDLLVRAGEPGLPRYPELHLISSGILRRLLLLKKLHAAACPLCFYAVGKVQRFSRLLLKKRRQRVNMDSFNILLGSGRLSDAFCRKEFLKGGGRIQETLSVDLHHTPSGRLRPDGHTRVPRSQGLLPDKF